MKIVAAKIKKLFIAWMALCWSVLGVSVAMKNWVEAMIDADKYLNVKPSPASNDRGIKAFLIGLLEAAKRPEQTRMMVSM